MTLIKTLLFGRNNLLSGSIAMAIVLMIALGCTCGKDFNLGNASSDSNSSSNSVFGDDNSGDVDDVLIKTTIKATTARFANAISTEDFSSLYAETATEFRSRYSEEDLKNEFKDFIRQKRQLLPILAKLFRWIRNTPTGRPRVPKVPRPYFRSAANTRPVRCPLPSSTST